MPRPDKYSVREMHAADVLARALTAVSWFMAGILVGLCL